MKTTTRSRTGEFIRSGIDIMKMRLHSEDSLTSVELSRLPSSLDVARSPERAWTPFRDDERVLQDSSEKVAPSTESTRAIQRVEQVRSDERSRLARELHDGVLQWLTGATLQLDVLLNLLGQDPEAARARLRHVKEMIVEEQAALRSWIQTAEPSSRAETIPGAELCATLTTMCERVEWQWGLRVVLTMVNGASFSKSLAYEVYRLVQEALSNVGRHALARKARVEVRTTNGMVRLVIQDDGNGFPFYGRYSLAELAASNLGPHTLKDRVSSLDGDLVLTSTPSGSRLEISVPLDRRAAQHARMRDRR